jgi:two-component system, chemotaxis family, chemotaxis protein CheY
MAKTILIVDDSRSLRTLVNLTLTRAGYEVVEAGDGKEALDKIGKLAKVHLIISDVNMPVMDGFAFVQNVKAHPRHRFTPVVMLTTEDEADKRLRGKTAGAKAWIVKPFEPPQLLDAVAKLILP